MKEGMKEGKGRKWGEGGIKVKGGRKGQNAKDCK